MTALLSGSGEAGEDFRGTLAALRFVAARESAGDDRRSQSAFGAVVGSLGTGMVEEGEQSPPSLAQEVGDALLVGIGSRRKDQGVGAWID